MAGHFAPYECKLDAATQKKALDELYEDPKNRQGAIDTFREWIQQQKHIKCPLDDVFLLAFLRGKHFSQLEARQALERFMKFREKVPEWMKDIDTMDLSTKPEMKRASGDGTVVLLKGRDAEGRNVVLQRFGNIDVYKKKPREAFCRLIAMACYVNYFCDEMSQVHGSVYLADFTGHTVAREIAIPVEMKTKGITMMQTVFPARVKAFHLYNGGAMMEFLMGIVSKLFTEKLKKRVHIHTHGLETVYDHVPQKILPKEYLPDDYQGTKSLQDIIAGSKNELQNPEIRERLKYLSSDQFYIKMEDKDTDVPVASFRKLNVD